MEKENKDIITAELMNFILDNVKLRLEITDASKDSLLTLYINTLCQNITIRTNRKKFPEDLKYVVIDMVVDKFDVNKKDSDIQNIQSMSENGRSVNYGVSSTTASRLNIIAQKQLDENDKLINRYRLVYKV